MYLLFAAVIISKNFGGSSPSFREADTTDLDNGRYGEMRERTKAAGKAQAEERMRLHEKEIGSVYEAQRRRVRFWARLGIGRSSAFDRLSDIEERQEREISQLHRGHEQKKMGKVHPQTGLNQHGIGRAGHGTRRNHGIHKVTGYSPRKPEPKVKKRPLWHKVIIGGKDK